jgi:hypothetical protein
MSSRDKGSRACWGWREGRHNTSPGSKGRESIAHIEPLRNSLAPPSNSRRSNRSPRSNSHQVNSALLLCTYMISSRMPVAANSSLVLPQLFGISPCAPRIFSSRRVNRANSTKPRKISSCEKPACNSPAMNIYKIVELKAARNQHLQKNEGGVPTISAPTARRALRVDPFYQERLSCSRERFR